MLADLDLLLIAVFCAADDLLPKARNNAKRIVTDAEVITLCVAQAIMGIPSDPRFLAVARKRLIHLFPVLPDRAGFYKRREALSDTIEALIAEFAARSPGSEDDMLLVDSTPVECARSRETVKRGGDSTLADALSDAADYGYCASHSRFFYGFRLHTLFAIDGTPRAVALTSAKVDEKEVCLQLVARCRRHPGQFLTLIGDKGFAGREFEDLVTTGFGLRLVRPDRRDEPPRHGSIGWIRQWIESVNDTFKGQLDLERHGGHTPAGVMVRVLQRILALTTAIWHNDRASQPIKRSLVAYDH